MNSAGERLVLATVSDELPAQRGGAKAILLTVFGELVLPAGGSAWTSSLVTAAEALGIGEKNARQAIARIGDEGLIESVRHGRRVRWTLSGDGNALLESGTRRIYEFGRSTVDWEGQWLVAHCAVAEAQRTLRHRLRTRLGFLGFGELSASLLVSPHVEREVGLRNVLGELDLTGECIVWRSTTGSAREDAELVARAWDLDELASFYVSFGATHGHRTVTDDESAFRALVQLVHDWRRFPFVDPELPTELLPDAWAGSTAAAVFDERHRAWSASARRWFADLDGRD